MSEKQESIRVSQVMAGALAAITAAVLGSTMGVAGTVIGAGLASVVTTVGGALYLRSIQRTRQGVRSVRNLVVARAGTTRVTLVDEPPEPAGKSDDAADSAADKPDEAAADAEPAEEAEDAGPSRRLRWPALIAASVLAFVLGMMVITGVEWLRGESLSGGEGTTLGDIVQVERPSRDDREKAPPATETTTPSTGGSTVTVTESPATSDDQEVPAPPTGSTTSQTSPPETETETETETTDSAPPGTSPPPRN